MKTPAISVPRKLILLAQTPEADGIEDAIIATAVLHRLATWQHNDFNHSRALADVWRATRNL